MTILTVSTDNLTGHEAITITVPFRRVVLREQSHNPQADYIVYDSSDTNGVYKKAGEETVLWNSQTIMQTVPYTVGYMQTIVGSATFTLEVT